MNSIQKDRHHCGSLVSIMGRRWPVWLSAPFIAPMNEPHYLVSVAANANQVTFGALLAFVAAASASIAIVLIDPQENIRKVWLLEPLVSG